MDFKLSSSIVQSSSTTDLKIRLHLLRVRQPNSLALAGEGSFVKRLQIISEQEGEDAELTGGTRSLHRRLLALNTYEVKRITSRETGNCLVSSRTA